uniref:Uncharacterized protein n=1 Tax=Strongyloides stercoralis TaxID=6248 RepID=A0AAF5D5K1_STRER
MNISKTIYIKKGDFPRPPITNYYYDNPNDFKVNKVLPIDRSYVTNKEKTEDDEYITIKSDKNHNNINNIIMQLKKGDINNKNYGDENLFFCKHNHIQPNIYQDNLENMIGHRELISTTFGQCICKNNCHDCIKKRKCLNIPIINLDDDTDDSNDCKKTLVIERFKFGPCLGSHKECFGINK